VGSNEEPSYRALFSYVINNELSISIINNLNFSVIFNDGINYKSTFLLTSVVYSHFVVDQICKVYFSYLKLNSSVVNRKQRRSNLKYFLLFKLSDVLN
jgi:hypothetical protein